MLTQVGITTQGQPVIGNIFWLTDTHGLPLEIILDFLRNNGMVPSWPDYIDRAIKAKWNLSNTITKILHAVSDTYGPACAAEVESRIRLYIVSLDK